MQNKKVIVITLNYNQNDYTLKCIDSLLKSDYDNFQILLIDNGSTEENYQNLKKSLVSDDRISLKRLDDNRGYVGGINFGLEIGVNLKPDYYLILNNDTTIDTKGILELVDTISKYDRKAIVTGKVLYADEPNRLYDVGYYFNSRKNLLFDRIGMNEIDEGQYDAESERDMLDDVFWLFPSELYHLIGGYSPYFWFNYEQADFAMRAKKTGYKLIYTPKARLWHKGSASIGGDNLNPYLLYWQTQSSLIFMFIHSNLWGFVKYFLSTLTNVIITTIKALIFRVKGNNKLNSIAKAKLKGFSYFLKWMVTRNYNNGELPKF